MDSDTEGYNSQSIVDGILNYPCQRHGDECPLLSGIFRAVLEGDFSEVKRLVESGISVNERVVDCVIFSLDGVSLLYCAVIKDDMEILEYLLTRQGVQMDCTCVQDMTPLHLAAELGHIKSADKLIQAGCDVNMANDNKDTALHMSVCHPDICHLLIQHGALIDVVNDKGYTPLHLAVKNECQETVYMLLYYNADVHAVGICFTPFALAFFHPNEDVQRVLLEYEDNFNRNNDYCNWFSKTLSMALQTDSPLAKDIIERGADVNYVDDPEISIGDSPFESCVAHAVDLSTFKMVWERLRYKDVGNVIDFVRILDYAHRTQSRAPYFQVIIDSDNFEPVVEFFSKEENYFLFVNKFADTSLELGQLTALTCRLLERGFRPSSYDIHAVFSNYGYCELFRILLYMDIDFSRGWLPEMALSRLTFDIDYNLDSVVDKVNDIPKEALLLLLEYCVCPSLIDALILQYSDDESMSAILSSLPKVPSLMELARNAARKQIWQAFKITNTCQFFTIIDHLDIPSVYKNVLTFKRKLYRIK